MSTETMSGDDEQNRIPENVIHDLRTAGASDLFIEVIQTPPSDVPGCDRNSSRQEILKYMDWSSGEDKTVVDYLSYGGGFFQSLFNGNPGGADQNNSMILDHVRGNTSPVINDKPL